MMNQREIKTISFIKGVNTSIIDKDWVLGHFLNAFYSSSEVKENFIFKGGTCLRKCYFKDYRFSEDLDFTLTNSKFKVTQAFISKIIRKAESNSIIKFHLQDIKEQFFNDIPQGYEIKIKYWGADHRPNSPIPLSNRWQTSIKLDISFSEKLILKPALKKIFHSYSDKHLITEEIPVYQLTEIMAEKLRSLIQRNRPRDIFDVWYLSKNPEQIDFKTIKPLLFEKAKDKNIEIIGPDQFVNKQKYRKNKRAWDKSLNHHLPEGNLPDFDTVYQTLNNLIKNILNK